MTPGGSSLTATGPAARAATLLVVGLLLPSPPRPSLAHTMDLLMMVVEGGRERTLEELQSLMAAEGYAFARDTPLEDVLPWHILEFRRA